MARVGSDRQRGNSDGPTPSSRSASHPPKPSSPSVEFLLSLFPGGLQAAGRVRSRVRSWSDGPRSRDVWRAAPSERRPAQLQQGSPQTQGEESGGGKTRKWCKLIFLIPFPLSFLLSPSPFSCLCPFSFLTGAESVGGAACNLGRRKSRQQPLHAATLPPQGDPGDRHHDD